MRETDVLRGTQLRYVVVGGGVLPAWSWIVGEPENEVIGGSIMEKRNNVMFIQVGGLRVKVSSILSYQMEEYKHMENPSLRFAIKVVTSRSSFTVKVRNEDEGLKILEELDNVLVLNR